MFEFRLVVHVLGLLLKLYVRTTHKECDKCINSTLFKNFQKGWNLTMQNNTNHIPSDAYCS